MMTTLGAMSVWTQSGLIAAGAVSLMFVLWVLQVVRRDASSVDVGWAFGLGVSAIVCALTGEGDPSRRLLIGVMGGVWGLRLAWHLLVDRIIGKPEDGRYQELRARWGAGANRFFFVFFQFQALLILILSPPFMLAAADQTPGLRPLDWLGLAVWIIGLAGESIADMQLRAFKAKPQSKGKTCREGLWRYSRHPNYFFEWLMWCAYAIVASGHPWGWVAWTAPALILFFVLKVTGIPPTEARALKTRGDDYRDYQRTTSAFVPWFPRKA
jgi:steroid 5-alpha reductase family enzyme